MAGVFHKGIDGGHSGAITRGGGGAINDRNSANENAFIRATSVCEYVQVDIFAFVYESST